MEDAMGRSIRQHDLVAFTRSSAGGAHGDRGRVLNAKPSDRNTLSVVCVDGATVEVEPSNCTVIDRSFLYPGLVVSSASDPGGQLGVVTGVHTALDLVRLNVDGEGHHHAAPVAIATGVSPGELRRVRELSLGDYVVSGGWLGRVVEVFLDVDVVLDGGGGGDACRVTDAGSKLSTVQGRDGLSLYTNCVFYPGQRVVGHRSVFKASKWLRGYWKPNRNSGTVTKVEIAGVLVYWVATSQLGTDREELVMDSAPPAYQNNPQNLTYFSSPPICYWSIGDRCFFRQGTPSTPTESSSSSSSGDHQEPPCAHPPAHELARASRNRPRTAMERLRRRQAGGRAHTHDTEFERPMCVTNTHTTADVVWQDGTRWRDVPSASLLPFMKRNEHEFLPGQHVVRVRGGEGSVAIDGGESAAARTVAPRAGIVRSIDCKDQTVSVSWLNAAEMHPGEHNVLGSEEEMLSAYDLGIDDRSKVFYGNVVVRRHGDEAVPVPGDDKQEMGCTAGDLSWVGHVTDLCQDGQVLVKWGDGHTSMVLPHDIAVVKLQMLGHMQREMGDWVYDDGDTDDTVDNAQEETAAQEPAAIDNNGNDEGDNGLVVVKGRVGTFIGAVFQIASGVLARCNKYIGSELAAVEPRSAPFVDRNINGDKVGATAASAVGERGHDDGGSDDRQGKEEGVDDSFRFKQFDVVQSPPDHHYLDNAEQGTGAGGRKWTKRVHKEWDILENNLPDTIYVQAYEDRMDLLRVVMVGASGTPYHDGLFFFDLQLPPSYPATPPLVNYRSFGLRVNPNLYPSGTVCLSLLNTYGGHGTELWSPEASTVLQVVVSIHGLVLNAQPYYNEAGYDVQVGTSEGLRNELPYSENAYLLTLQTMLQLLRRPPAGFEDFVRGHFKRRGQHVLRACEAYLEGCHVGTFDGEAHAAEASTARPCSTGFRLALANVVPRLVEAFTAIGTDGCHELELTTR